MQRCIAGWCATVLLSCVAHSQICYQLDEVDVIQAASVDRTGGGSALVVFHRRQRVYEATFGDFTVDRVVPIASSSKFLSALVIMSLVDDELLSLDDAAAPELPTFDAVSGAMTVGQMFAHTAGLPSEPTYERWWWLPDMQACVELIATVEPRSSPWTEVYYNNLSQQMAARLGEIRAGDVSWNHLFAQRIGAPLGLTQTDYFGLSPGPTNNPFVAGGMRTNLRDYGRVMQMVVQDGLFDGEPVLSADSLEAMFADASGALPITRSPYERIDPFVPGAAAKRTGIGVFLDDFDAVGRANSIISGGAFGTHMFIDRERDFGGVFMAYQTERLPGPNGAYNPAHVVFFEVLDALERAFDAPPGDLDGDRDVDVRDVAALQWCFQGTDQPACAGADLDCDGVITADDWVALSGDLGFGVTAP